MQPLYETMKVQIVFCCVAILCCCCWNGKATISNGCKFAFSVLLTISFKCLTTITRSTWVLLFCLDEKAQNVCKVHSFSNRAIESKYFIRERGLIRFFNYILKKPFETSTETFSPNSFLFQRYIQTKNRQTLHTTYICMIHLYLQQNNLKFAVRARRWHAVVVGWETYCLNNLARELTTCLRSGG